MRFILCHQLFEACNHLLQTKRLGHRVITTTKAEEDEHRMSYAQLAEHFDGSALMTGPNSEFYASKTETLS
jgi:hypothetical protein